MTIDVMQLRAATWDFADPAGSQVRFADLAKQHTWPVRGQLLTQVARAQGLQRAFDCAHATLDAIVDEHDGTDAVLRVLLALERGRVFNSAGQVEQAQPLFQQAWNEARSHQLDALAIDAAHMLAIVADAAEAQSWNEIALDLATSSSDPHAQRWQASLYNNLGWTYHDRGHFDAALAHFYQSLEARRQRGEQQQILIAQWCVARCLRSMGRIDEAFEMQQSLLSHWEQRGEVDGYVHEELAECLHALGRTEEAQSHFRVAYEILSKDAWLAENESSRLKRLKSLAGGYNRRP